MRKDGIKLVIIPKHSDINKGDLVQIIKLEEIKNGERRKE